MDDGPEFTPDGRFDLFQLRPAGTACDLADDAGREMQRQVTTDDLQDWFPHVSPDGRSIVFLSFERDVEPDDLPFYRQVYLG